MHFPEKSATSRQGRGDWAWTHGVTTAPTDARPAPLVDRIHFPFRQEAADKLSQKRETRAKRAEDFRRKNPSQARYENAAPNAAKAEGGSSPTNSGRWKSGSAHAEAFRRKLPLIRSRRRGPQPIAR